MEKEEARKQAKKYKGKALQFEIEQEPAQQDDDIWRELSLDLERDISEGLGREIEDSQERQEEEEVLMLANEEAAVVTGEGEGIDEGVCAEQVKALLVKAKKIGQTSDKIPPLIYGPVKERRFNSVESWRVYLKMNNKNVNPERAFHGEALQDENFVTLLEDLQLGGFAKLAPRAAWEVCRLIYANIVTCMQEKRPIRMVLRGKEVSFTPSAIDKFLGRRLLTKEEKREQRKKWAEIIEGLPNDSERGWTFVSQLFGTDETHYYTGNKNFRQIHWSVYQSVHRELIPWVKWVQSNIIATGHDTETHSRNQCR